MAQDVEISHKDGRRYGVTLKDFHGIYEPQGFKIDRNADQTEYVAPESKAEKPAKPRPSRAKTRPVVATPVAVDAAPVDADTDEG